MVDASLDLITSVVTGGAAAGHQRLQLYISNFSAKQSATRLQNGQPSSNCLVACNGNVSEDDCDCISEK